MCTLREIKTSKFSFPIKPVRYLSAIPRAFYILVSCTEIIIKTSCSFCNITLWSLELLYLLRLPCAIESFRENKYILIDPELEMTVDSRDQGYQNTSSVLWLVFICRKAVKVKGVVFFFLVLNYLEEKFLISIDDFVANWLYFLYNLCPLTVISL